MHNKIAYTGDMIKQTKRVVILLIAVLCVIVGLFGLILPLIPGIAFFMLALVIFSLFFPIVGEKMHYHTRHYPKLQTMIVRMREWVARVVGEV
jgi:uncharacterized membrane protein YbaN (DUF454 family)